MNIGSFLKWMRQPHQLERQLFVVGAPFAGYSLLNQVLLAARDIRRAPHDAREQAEATIQALGETPTPQLIEQLQQLYRNPQHGWLLEQYGGYSLRVPLLAAAFPQARFVFLARNPAEQVARMLAAWRSGSYITHAALPNWTGSWSLPLIPGWQQLHGRQLPEIVLAQWATLTNQALDDLAQLAGERWRIVQYEALRNDPHTTIQQLQELGLRWQQPPRMAEALARRVYLDPADLALAQAILPAVADTVQRLRILNSSHDETRISSRRNEGTKERRNKEVSAVLSTRTVRFLPLGMRRNLVAGSVAAALLGSGLVPAQVAQAATFEVTNLNDSGAGSLRDAIDSANETPEADVITFQAGLTGTIVLTSGQLEINNPLDIQGPGADVISVSGNDASRVFYLYNGSANIAVSISGLTITDGTANIGGGIANFDEDLTLDGVTITGNNAIGDGGGLWADGFAMDLTIRDSIISGNSSRAQGGGIFVDYTGGPLLIQDSAISGNSATGNGGGIYFYGPDHAVTIERSTISGNTSLSAGGGIYLYDIDGGPFIIRETTISGNQAEAGGGLFLYGPDNPVLIENSTISGNTATTLGGGIYLYNSTYITISHSTIAANSATIGGGIASDGIPIISHSIIGDNSALIDPDVSFYVSGGNLDRANKVTVTGKAKQKAPRPQALPNPITYSLIENQGNQTSFVDPFGNIINEDPQLGPLQDNGGPTETQLPAATSPVIDAGDPELIEAPASDQRGLARINGAAVDMGAVEFTPGVINFTSSTFAVNEGLPSATLTVTRTGGTDGAASVEFSTSAGSATAGDDFTSTVGALQWASGDGNIRQITIPVIDDALDEPAETFTVTLANAQNATLGTTTIATVTIIDDDIRFDTFLPLVSGASQPDLVVSSITLTPNKTSFVAGEPVEIAVTITNQGSAPTQPFWVDLYLNPSEQPSVNRTWNLVCSLTPCYGIAWGVAQPLQPGQSITIRSTIDSFAAGHSNWRGAFASGTNQIVVFADSYNRAGAAGGMIETNENNNTAILTISVTGTNPPNLNNGIILPEQNERPDMPAE
jgi:parallel beta-helix repeat protein